MKLRDVAIIYVDRGRRLFVSGIFEPSLRQRLWCFWDTVSLQNQAFNVWWYSAPMHRSLPLQFFQRDEETGVAIVCT